MYFVSETRPTDGAGLNATSTNSTLEPFQKRGLDFVGPFKLIAAQIGNKYIIMATNYCTKWIEDKELHDNTAN